MKARHHATPSRAPALFAMPTEGPEAAVAALVAGGSVFGLTCGQYSLLDLVQAILDRVGPADVRLSTWSTGIRDAGSAKALLDSGRIRTLKLYTDRSFPSRQPQYAAALVQMFGAAAICCTDIHAKIATISGGDWRIVVRSSMNLNRNPRFEQFDIDDSPALFDFVGTWLDELDRLAPHGMVFSHAESERAFREALASNISVDAAVAAMVGAEPPEEAPPDPWAALPRQRQWGTD